MACAASDVEVANLTVTFDFDSVVAYKLVNLRRYIINSFENVYNFCCQLKLLNNYRKCPRFRRDLKLSVDHRTHHSTPISFVVSTKTAISTIFLFERGHFFKSPT